MYATAYTSEFRSLEGVCWTVEIDLSDYQDEPLEIGLDADHPVTIEWQETKITDAVQPSTCTLKVVNDKDRQMIRMMTSPMALCRVIRDGKPYWTGLLDDAVYEEPYSYRDDYVTEITFSDFGILNRKRFVPHGVNSLLSVVNECLSAAKVDSLYLKISGSLMHTSIRPANLSDMFINTMRFDGLTMRETLEGILCAVGMRIIQMGGTILVYDIDRLVDDHLSGVPLVPIDWTGTDARLKGGETFGRFQLSFDHKSEPVVADGTIDPDASKSSVSERYWASYFETGSLTTKGFYIDINGYLGYDNPLPTLMHDKARYFRTLSVMTECHEAGIAYRVCCFDSTQGAMRNLLATSTEFYHNRMEALFSLESRYLPNVANRDEFQLQVSLDLLFSIKYNPFQDAEVQGAIVEDDWKDWQNSFYRIYVPVKLELVDDSDNVVAHYCNARLNGVNGLYLIPLGMGKGIWKAGEAQWSEMLLAYYTDDLNANPLDGWTGNRMAIEQQRTKVPDIVKKRGNGEFVPLPNGAGRLRLTISNGISTDRICDNNHERYNSKIMWQLYRDPKISIVKAFTATDDVDTAEITDVDIIDVGGDTYSETLMIGTGGEGISPASIGVLFSAMGDVYVRFMKHNVNNSLIKHRLNAIRDRLWTTHQMLSGTARLVPYFMLRSDASTTGFFLPVGMTQYPYEDVEEVVTTLVYKSTDRYMSAWSDPICALEEEGFRIAWSNSICVRLPDRYVFAWNSPVCSRLQIPIELEWEEF